MKLYLLLFIVGIASCEMKISKKKRVFDYFEEVIKPVQDSLQRDNIAMDNLGEENLTLEQKITYNRNCEISIMLNEIKLRSLAYKQ